MTAWWLINCALLAGWLWTLNSRVTTLARRVRELEFEQARLHIGQPAAMSVKLTVPNNGVRGFRS